MLHNEKWSLVSAFQIRLWCVQLWCVQFHSWTFTSGLRKLRAAARCVLKVYCKFFIKLLRLFKIFSLIVYYVYLTINTMKPFRWYRCLPLVYYVIIAKFQCFGNSVVYIQHAIGEQQNSTNIKNISTIRPFSSK